MTDKKIEEHDVKFEFDQWFTYLDLFDECKCGHEVTMVGWFDITKEANGFIQQGRELERKENEKLIIQYEQDLIERQKLGRRQAIEEVISFLLKRKKEHWDAVKGIHTHRNSWTASNDIEKANDRFNTRISEISIIVGKIKQKIQEELK